MDYGYSAASGSLYIPGRYQIENHYDPYSPSDLGYPVRWQERPTPIHDPPLLIKTTVRAGSKEYPVEHRWQPDINGTLHYIPSQIEEVDEGPQLIHPAYHEHLSSDDQAQFADILTDPLPPNATPPPAPRPSHKGTGWPSFYVRQTEPLMELNWPTSQNNFVSLEHVEYKLLMGNGFPNTRFITGPAPPVPWDCSTSREQDSQQYTSPPHEENLYAWPTTSIIEPRPIKQPPNFVEILLSKHGEDENAQVADSEGASTPESEYRAHRAWIEEVPDDDMLRADPQHPLSNQTKLTSPSRIHSAQTQNQHSLNIKSDSTPSKATVPFSLSPRRTSRSQAVAPAHAKIAPSVCNTPLLSLHREVSRHGDVDNFTPLVRQTLSFKEFSFERFAQPAVIAQVSPTSLRFDSTQSQPHREATSRNNFTPSGRCEPLPLPRVTISPSRSTSSQDESITHNTDPAAIRTLSLVNSTLNTIENLCIPSENIQGSLLAVRRSLIRQHNISKEQWNVQSPAWYKKYTGRVESIEGLLNWINESTKALASDEVSITATQGKYATVCALLHDYATQLHASFDRLHLRYLHILYSQPGVAPHQKRALKYSTIRCE